MHIGRLVQVGLQFRQTPTALFEFQLNEMQLAVEFFRLSPEFLVLKFKGSDPCQQLIRVKRLGHVFSCRSK
jgi:hypothetical protein